ncbi:PAS domain S-box protein [Cyclobacterium sp. 1_MG-2023]|uniref:PAS domain-containing sensor histidine kinase n=1 Tax=Cyclobacterium sp. 1_MG-2023 TaxID=3062681 RepID=UPI0026E47A1E|nr:PAS domain-containing sensor histidine kinase [Cyclobacterium sp. 1_MG-2023]MDO6438726.1 PAS domain S-box protein [Cyclobacterium sp. 1_MG-2023]
MSAYEEENLRWSEVLVSCDVGAWELDPTSLILRFSPSGQKILGLDLAKFETISHFIEYIGELDKASIQGAFQRLLREKVAFDEIFCFANQRCIKLKGKALNNEGDKLRFIGTVEHIGTIDKMQKAEPALTNYYGDLFESNPMPIVIWDCDTQKIIDCNREAVKKYGYTKAVFLGLSISVIVPKEDITLNNCFTGLEINGDEVQQRICQHFKKSGESFFAKMQSKPLVIDGKECIMELIADFTSQLEAEEQLLDSVQELSDYRFALDESCLVLILDESMKLDYLNRKLLDISGYEGQELSGKRPTVIYEENQALKDCMEAVSKGQMWRGELKGIKKLSGVFWIDTVITPFKDNTGKTYQYIWVGYDITEKHKADESLFKERFLLRSIIDNLPIQIYVKDIMGRHIINNKTQYRDFLGAETEEETLGKTAFDYYPYEIAKKMTVIDRHVIVEGQSVKNLEESYTDANGQLRWFLTSKVALKNASNKIVGLVGMTRDVTDRKEEEAILKNLNTELTKKAKALEQSNQELEQFAYIASHDLQEPLRMITGFVSLLEKKYSSVLDEKGIQYMHFVVDGASRMRNIIMDLLTYSRVGREGEKLKETDIGEIISNALNLQKTLINQKRAKITVGPMPKLKVPVSPLNQVFLNLINNSLKYQPEGATPRIKIYAKERKEFWEFSVEDNGIGIPPSSQDKVFILFSRLHAKSQYSGTGIGLAMCKKIIENLGGDINFKSKEGEGSTFYFSVPKVIY